MFEVQVISNSAQNWTT